MDARFFTLMIALATGFSLAAIAIVATGLDPEQAGFAGHAIMQISIFFAAAGLFFLLIDWVKKTFIRSQLLYDRTRSSLRHALLASILLSGWLFLKTNHVLRWWNLVLFILALTVLEFFFMTSTTSSTYERETTTPEN